MKKNFAFVDVNVSKIGKNNDPCIFVFKTQWLCIKQIEKEEFEDTVIVGQTTQWQKEKEQKDKQQSTKHTHKTKDQVTRTQLKTQLVPAPLVAPEIMSTYCT